MPRKRNKFKESPVFGSIWQWNWHTKLSLLVLFICFAIQILIADPLTPGNISIGILNVIYISVFPILMIWFAENLEDVLGDGNIFQYIGLSFEIVVRFIGWLLMLIFLFLSITQLWAEN